jgi:hypothetical protein
MDNISTTSKNICSICWSSMNINNNTNTKCNHLFHKICIDKWLENNTTCPICRTIIKKSKSINTNIVVPINVPPPIIQIIQNSRNNTSIIQNKIFLVIFMISYFFVNIYNLIMLFLSNNYINSYYDRKVMDDEAKFLIIQIILIALIPGTIIKKNLTNCIYLIMLILYIILIACYIVYYKNMASKFNLLSLPLKINFIISFGLHTLFCIINVIVATIIL